MSIPFGFVFVSISLPGTFVPGAQLIGLIARRGRHKLSRRSGRVDYNNL